MADIKSLSVKIGADTSDFIKELNKADRSIKNTSKTAKELQKSLELDFSETRFLQAQKKTQKALEDTRAKAEVIRKELKYLKDNGFVNTDSYEKLEMKLAESEVYAQKLNQQLKDINDIGAKQATKSFDEFSSKLETAAKKMTVVSAAAGAGLVGISKLAKDAVKVGDDLQTTADSYNLSAEAIQKWNYIAIQSDVASEQLYKGMQKVNTVVGNIMQGTSNNATKAIKDLYGDLNKLPQNTEQAFTSIIDGLSKVNDSTMRSYYATQIFGEELSTKLIPIIKGGTDNLSNLSAEFEAVGYLSNSQVRKLADFDNELNRINKSFENVKTEIGMAFIPVLDVLANILNTHVVPLIKRISDFIDNIPSGIKNFTTTLLLLVTALSPMLLGVSRLISLLSKLPNILTLLSTHPIIAAVLAGAAAVLYLYNTNTKLAKSIDNIINMQGRAIKSVLNPLFAILKNIMQIVTPLIDLIGNMLVLAIDKLIIVMRPFLWVLEKISDIISFIIDGIGKIFNFSGWFGLGGNNESEATNTNDSDLQNYNFKIPSTSTNNSIQNYSNDTYNVNIELNASGELEYDTETLANEVIRKIVVAKQSSGR